MENSSSPKQAISVGQLNRCARQLLEIHLSLVWVRGEISNLARPSSGHWYFTLKDADAQVRCAMFRNRNSLVNFRPGNGQQVLVRGRVSLYEARGDYQLLIDHLAPDGLGALQQQFEQLRSRLADEGLFEPARKRPLPAFPRRIGIVTSPTGAAIRDILHGLARRLAVVPVTVYPTAVQGANAAAEIVAAIGLANRHAACDLLIVGRGGGSLEDLWPFNEEPVARAIAASHIPVISAVGHETDFTIADFVADLRATTPTAAAELAVPDGMELLATLTMLRDRLVRIETTQLAAYRRQIDWLKKRLRNPADRLRDKAQHLDNLEIRLRQVISSGIRQNQHRLALMQRRLETVGLSVRLDRLGDRLQSTRIRLLNTGYQFVEGNKQRLARLSSLLDAVSPLNTLKRGYSISRDQNGALLRSIAAIPPGSLLSIIVTDGEADCRVTRVTKSDPAELLTSTKQR